MQHALRLGIPMVVSGTGEDKADSNAIVGWSGVGINLGVTEFGVGQLAAAVDKILKDDSYKNRARTLSEEFDKYDVGRVFDKAVQDAFKEWAAKRRSNDKEL